MLGLQANAMASTVEFFNNGNTTTLNIGNNATGVNIGGTTTTIQTPIFIQSGYVAGGPVIAANSLMVPNWAVPFSSMAGGIAFANPLAYLSASLTLQTASITPSRGIILSDLRYHERQ